MPLFGLLSNKKMPLFVPLTTKQCGFQPNCRMTALYLSFRNRAKRHPGSETDRDGLAKTRFLGIYYILRLPHSACPSRSALLPGCRLTPRWQDDMGAIWSQHDEKARDKICLLLFCFISQRRFRWLFLINIKDHHKNIAI